MGWRAGGTQRDPHGGITWLWVSAGHHRGTSESSHEDRDKVVKLLSNFPYSFPVTVTHQTCPDHEVQIVEGGKSLANVKNALKISLTVHPSLLACTLTDTYTHTFLCMTTFETLVDLSILFNVNTSTHVEAMSDFRVLLTTSSEYWGLDFPTKK